MRPTAIVMNMYYTGLGIARSLGQRGVPVIGLTAERGIYGNFTRYAKVLMSPDSRHEADALLQYLLRLGENQRCRGVIFPTRDDDVMFLDRYREQLEPWYSPVLPPRDAVRICLNKWETFLAAERSAVPTPRSWCIRNLRDLQDAASEVTFPCVLKPLLSQHWRRDRNWELVGARKAIGISSTQELFNEYAVIERADSRVVLQEMIPGKDDCLMIAGCYVDRGGTWAGGFSAQKLVQSPEGFGTGCVVQGVNLSELFAPTERLLKSIGFSGIAEVEYKWDARDRSFKLIEINPRPWDQHALGRACGVDVIFMAYREHAGFAVPKVTAAKGNSYKWIAEDTFFTEAVRLAWRRNGRLRKMLGLSRGKRIYAIWMWKDPLPMLGYALTRYIPSLIRACWQAMRWRLTRSGAREATAAARSIT